ncbi:ZIP family metal transporter [Sulfitobacter pacificus]|uniref:Divalent heavy-metal cations transporter n=1 Tax=Sulfitobacter pacificus TaxID=1499314 RepID=A0ABQ5VK13_9RHOB|nr:zinc transporter [Sulfitobacter pacificus]GLQ27475.1 divalent heavy-metal cations transporter [Sulfitobacter pacificus]
MLVIAVICATSGALILGAVWGIYGRFPAKLEGFLVAMAGGALIVSVVAELLEPASQKAALWLVLGAFACGSVTFTAIDTWIDRRVGEDSGGGLLAAIVLDGIPENIALGVVLITVEPIAVLALAGSIFLSNLPEAAGGARGMAQNGWGRGKVLGIWALTAAVLSAAAVLGNQLLSPMATVPLAIIQAFAAGAVVSSLATEVFPKAYKQDQELAGIAVAIGVILAFALHHMSATLSN